MIISNDCCMIDRRRTTNKDEIKDEGKEIALHLGDNTQTRSSRRPTIINTPKPNKARIGRTETQYNDIKTVNGTTDITPELDWTPSQKIRYHQTLCA